MVDLSKPKLVVIKSLRVWAVLLTALAVLIYSSCGEDEFNLYSTLGSKDVALKSNKAAKLEQARLYIDSGNYSEANSLLQPMMEKDDTDSNDARLLYAAAILGEVGLDIWSIISEILEDSGKKSSRTGGVDTIFNTFSDSILGTGAERASKIQTLASAISNLLSAPDVQDKRINNTACLLAGLLAVPTITDATAAMNGVSSVLQQIGASASNNGATCPNLSTLDAAMSGIQAVSTNFNLVLSAAANCKFLNLNSAAALMNQVEQSLSRLRTNADKGCEIPSCPAAVPNCAALFPRCVQETLAVGRHPEYAANGSIESCEIVLNCTDTTDCFD